MKLPNKRLIELREKANLSQKNLADMIGISQSMIARIETGEREPRKHIKIKLARFFKVSVEWLFYEDNYDLWSTNSSQSTGTEGSR